MKNIIIFIILLSSSFLIYPEKYNILSFISVELPNDFEILKIGTSFIYYNKNKEYNYTVSYDLVYNDQFYNLDFVFLTKKNISKELTERQLTYSTNKNERRLFYDWENNIEMREKDYKDKKTYNLNKISYAESLMFGPMGYQATCYILKFDNQLFQECLVISEINNGNNEILKKIIQSIKLENNNKYTTVNQKDFVSSGYKVLEGLYRPTVDKLRMRKTPSRIGQILSVLSKDYTYIIIEIGEEETIDGIKSNWVRVAEYNIFSFGKVGWVFQGYLRKMTDKEEEELYSNID